MENNNYEIKNERYDHVLKLWEYIVYDKDLDEQFTFIINEDNKFVFNPNIDQKKAYFAYIEFVNKTCFDYFFRKLKLERVPAAYLSLYEQAINDNQNLAYKKIDEAILNVNQAIELLNKDKEDSDGAYFSKINSLNEAQNALNNVKKLSLKR